MRPPPRRRPLGLVLTLWLIIAGVAVLRAALAAAFVGVPG